MSRDLPGQLLFPFDPAQRMLEQGRMVLLARALATKAEEEDECDHHWYCYGTYDDINFYRCSHCGKESED